MSYRFLEDIATADAAFESIGKTPEELFSSAAEALEETQVDTKQLENKEQRTVNLESETLENLLFDFLNELIFHKDAEALVFSEFNIEIQADEGGFASDRKIASKDRRWRLKGTLRGEKIDPKRHELRTDVKAVTKHRFGIKETPKGFKAMVILDI
jgi:SHS2 domain-containing protein